MKKRRKPKALREDMRAEYDFSGAVRNKYAPRLGRYARAVVLDPDVAAAYPDSRSVNRVLRAALKARRVPSKARRASS